VAHKIQALLVAYSWREFQPEFRLALSIRVSFMFNLWLRKIMPADFIHRRGIVPD
jgi:hypothetical protein